MRQFPFSFFSAFSPMSLPGLAAWYDASDSNTVLTQVGGATNFVAANSQRLTCASNESLQCGGTSFAFSFWINNSGAGQRIGGKEGETGFLIASGVYVQFNAGSALSGLVSGVVTTNSWAFVYGQYDIVTQVASVSVNNGALFGGTAGDGPVSGTGGLRWGQGISPNNQFGSYDLDEITFHKRVLTADERTFLYNGGAGRTYAEAPASLKENLVSWWSMNAPASGDWLDQHGTNHLTPSVSRPTATTGVTFNVAQNGQTVRRWLSRHSPAVYWDQGTLANQPTFTNATTGLTFNGATSFMDGTGTMAGVFRNKGYGYIFAVAQDTNPTGGDAAHRVVHFSNDDSEGLFRAAFSTRATTNVYQIGGRRLDADTSVSITGESNDANLHLLDANYLWSAGTLALQRDGSQILTGSFASSGNTSDTASWNVILGRTGGTDGFFPGNIREIIIVNEQLTAAQILATRRYLQRKWGTPALP
jgi:hypothetical protein